MSKQVIGKGWGAFINYLQIWQFELNIDFFYLSFKNIFIDWLPPLAAIGAAAARAPAGRGAGGGGGEASLPASSEAETRAGGRSRRHRTSATGSCSSRCPCPRRRLSSPSVITPPAARHWRERGGGEKLPPTPREQLKDLAWSKEDLGE